jgi:hypothetical protein
MADLVNHPPHYKSESGLESIEVIEAFDLGFCLGNVVKYILRAGRKDDAVLDLQKARWYLDREIARRQRRQATAVPASYAENDYQPCVDYSVHDSCDAPPEVKVHSYDPILAQTLQM